MSINLSNCIRFCVKGQDLFFPNQLQQKRYANTKVLGSSLMNKFLTLQKVKKDRDVRRELLNQTETSMLNLLF